MYKGGQAVLPQPRTKPQAFLFLSAPPEMGPDAKAGIFSFLSFNPQKQPLNPLTLSKLLSYNINLQGRVLLIPDSMDCVRSERFFKPVTRAAARMPARSPGRVDGVTL